MWVRLVSYMMGSKKASLLSLVSSHLRNMSILVGTAVDALDTTMFQFSLEIM